MPRVKTIGEYYDVWLDIYVSIPFRDNHLRISMCTVCYYTAEILKGTLFGAHPGHQI